MWVRRKGQQKGSPRSLHRRRKKLGFWLGVERAFSWVYSSNFKLLSNIHWSLTHCISSIIRQISVPLFRTKISPNSYDLQKFYNSIVRQQSEFDDIFLHKWLDTCLRKWMIEINQTRSYGTIERWGFIIISFPRPSQKSTLSRYIIQLYMGDMIELGASVFWLKLETNNWGLKKFINRISHMMILVI